MTYPMMQHIPLKSAYLCQDCNSVGNCSEQCPACASSILMNLSGILDRDLAHEMAHESVIELSAERLAAVTYEFPGSIPALALSPASATAGYKPTALVA